MEGELRRGWIGGLALAGSAAVATLLFPLVGRAWLAAAFFWSGVPVGSIGFLLVMVLVGGAWRERLAGSLWRGAAAIGVSAVALLPVLIGLGALYPWMAAPSRGFRGVWLQPWPFVLRTILWFAGLAAILLLLGRRPERAPAIAVFGLLFLFPVGSLIAVDWLMSLQPDFHSSGFGLQALSIQFDVALMAAVLRAPPDRSGTTGALMLTLLMLWGYFAYLPFFILWSGNAPAAAAWYLARGGGGWGLVAALAVAGHAAPLLALLAPAIRRSPEMLRRLAVVALVGDALQAAWIVLPQGGPVRIGTAFLYLVALAAIGGATLFPVVRR